ncbi:hypothetical protein D3C78_1353950 [compost metagenome]
MGGEVKTENLIFTQQFFRSEPGLESGQDKLFRAVAAAGTEHVRLADGAIVLRHLRIPDNAFQPADQLGAVAAETIESAGIDQAFQHAPVDLLGVDA